MKLGKPFLYSCVLVASSLALACSKKDSGKKSTGPGLGVGAACQSSADCRTRLACDNVSKTCVPSASTLEDGTCSLSAECVSGYYCSQQGKCARSGQGAAGAVCSFEGDCASGLSCALTGLTGVCQKPGTRDVGASCLDTTECMAGLLCVTGICSTAMARPWTGAVCPIEEQTPRVLFHVPRASDPPATNDFYRLPFPNDIRIKNGKVSLTGHPKPGARILPFDVVERYLTAIEAESTGFGANQTTYFRFSKAFDLAKVPSGCSSDFVDITPGSPTYGMAPQFECGGGNARSTYVCGPYLWIRTALGVPLRPGNTYAVVVKKGLVDAAGAPFAPDDDFVAMLAAAAPADPELAAAHVAYKPLRDYLAATLASGAPRLLAADLVAAAVFTVEKYEDPLVAIDTAVAAAPAPAVSKLVHCGDPGVLSPCDDGLTGAAHVRGCLADDVNPSFDTYQGLVALPAFQKGTPPYLTPADGGSIEYVQTGAPAALDGGTGYGGGAAVDGGTGYDGGAPSTGSSIAVVQRTENVCFSLTVPKGSAPASGWPLVVYGHGTGGSYRSIVASGLAEDFAKGVAPAGLKSTAGATPVPMATLGYDGIMHGTRAAGSTAPVGELVYNFLNPAAARDNALQAAADLLAIPRALPSLAPLGISIDGQRLALYGHSQGGNGASLVAARPSSYKAIVMSGTGGLLIQTLLGKTQPIDIPAVLPYLLGEPGPVDATHAVLSLMQMYFERSDSVNFGRRLFREPLSSTPQQHFLHVVGTQDSYSVLNTQKAYGIAAGFSVAGTPVAGFGVPIPAPVWNNQDFASQFGPIYHTLTAVELQYEPAATYDGHFVSTQNPAARAAIQQMLVTTFRDGIPTVSP
jgi:hypothetical protein